MAEWIGTDAWDPSAFDTIETNDRLAEREAMARTNYIEALIEDGGDITIGALPIAATA